MSKVWLITGASRGMGLEVTRSLLDAGHRVVATARRPDVIKDALGTTNENLLTLTLDVTKTAQADAVASAAITKFGRIDVLVNNAGYGQLGWFENLSEDQIQRQFNTNVFGAMHVTRAVLPYMRQQKAGHIFTVTSVAGLIAVAGSSIYGASKFAVEGWMEGLHQELALLGIATTAIEPGFFKTDFLDASSVNYGEHDIAEYAEASARFKAFHDDMNHQQLGDPAKLGQLMMKLAEMKETPVRLAAGSDAVEWVIKKGDSLRQEATEWQEYSASTDRDGAKKVDSLPSNV